MKRCPQCEFIYEDDQSLCDMDGILLVFDSQKLPKPGKSEKSQLRNRILTVFAVLVLTSVLFLVYYVATHQRKVTPSSDSGTAVNATQPASTDTAVATEPENKVITPEPRSEPKPEVTKTTPNTDLKKPATTPKANPKKVSSSQPQENDSKIGSFVKKTGRLLKKPFKF
jgi:hypothetical protein